MTWLLVSPWNGDVCFFLESEPQLVRFQSRGTIKNMYIWVSSWRFGCLVTWFCYHFIAKPGNKTATPSWLDPYMSFPVYSVFILKSWLLTCRIFLTIIRYSSTFSIISWIFIKQNKTKLIMEQTCTLPILYCQYHACWCPGELSHQGISRHDIDP